MRIVYRGQEYELIGPDKLTRPEASLIKQHTGLTVGNLVDSLRTLDLDAIAAYLMVMKKRAGEQVKWSDFDDMTLGDCDFPDDASEETDEDNGEDEDDDRPDPT